MKNVFFKSRAGISRITTLLLPAVAVFLLSGCCCIPLGNSGASKNCNCSGSKPQHAINKKTNAQPGAEGAVSLASANKVVSKSTTQANQPRQAIQPVTLALEKNQQKAFLRKKLPLGIKGIRTNIIAGPNMSFKSSKEDYGNTDHKHTPRAGIQFGVAMSYAFSDRFAVAPALIFKQNSASETLNYSIGDPGGPGGGSTEIKSKYNYNYLSAPVLAEVKVNDQLTVMAGPELNLLLGANVKTSGYGDTDKTDIKDNSVKIGAGIQAGVKYNIPGSPVGIQLIYDHRLSRLNEKTSSDYNPGGGYETPAWNMKGIQLGVTCDICELLKNRR